MANISVWWRFVLLVLAGVVAALGQAPTDLWPLTILALASLLLVIRQSVSPRQAAFHAWAFGVGYFAFALRWIIEPFLVDAARHGWMAPFAIALMAAGAALFWALAGYIAARVRLGNIALFALALVWVEIARSLILTGFPWVLLGHIWVPTPLAQMAAFGGPHLLTFVTMLAAWALVVRRWGGVVLVAVIGGLWLLPQPPAPDLTGQPIVRLVQPNAPQHQKWDPAFRDVFVKRMIDATRAGDVPDLVVWPETSVPTLLNYVEDNLSGIASAARGAPVVFGIQRRDESNNYFNSLIVFGPDGTIDDIYDKQHLVPFGEYIPGGSILQHIGLSALADNIGGGFTSGTRDGPVDIPGLGLAVPLICYEGIFAEEIHTGPISPRLLLMITNDAWFGQHVGPFQHLAQAQLRAIEQGLPLVRVANTGISAMIDPAGRIMDSLPMGVDGYFDAPLPPVIAPPPYARFGDWPFLILLILLTVAQTLAVHRNKD